MADKDIIADALEAFKQAEEAEAENRQLWLEDVKFARLGEQWPDKVKQQREAEGRPCLTINRLPAFIRQVTNDARQNRPAIKVHPVDDDASQETAEILNGLIRNIEQSSNAEVAYDTALDHAVSGGYGYFRVATEYAKDDAFEQDIVIERIPNPLCVFGDPYSVAADSSDWNTAFVTNLLTEAAFKRKYPSAAIKPFDADIKDAEGWFSDERIRIAEYWTRVEVPKTIVQISSGEVMTAENWAKLQEYAPALGISVIGERVVRGYKTTQRIITGAETLEANEWAGCYIPIIPVYGDEVIVEGKRHFLSLVRFAKDPQQMFNYWRTASTELVALAPKAPFIGPKGAFNSDAEKWATANTRSHAYIEYDGMTPPQRQAFAGVPAGALQEALNASDDMKAIIGIYDASLGARGNETSGRAIVARQRESDVSTFNFIDNLSRAIKHAGRVIVDLIPHVYNVPRIIRIVHEDGTNESVKINEPHQAEQPGADYGGMNPQEAIDPREQEEQREFAQGVVKLYDLTVGKYDVTVEAGPSYATKRMESADQMINFLQAFPAAAPMVGDLVAKNLDWPGADDIGERLKAMLPPQVQGQNPMVMQLQQAMQQMDAQAREAVSTLRKQLDEKTAEAAAKQQDAAIKQAELSIKAQELAVKQFEAETARMEAAARLRLDEANMKMQGHEMMMKMAHEQKEPVNEEA